MANVKYTLWFREYDDGKRTLLYNASKGNADTGDVEKDKIEGLVDHHIANCDCIGPLGEDWRFPDEQDSMTTIPAIRRRFGSDHTDYPVENPEFHNFEKAFESRKEPTNS